jgi:hypothetical protein
VAAGAGLIGFGIGRSSWLGLAMAAAGGYLAYRGLRPGTPTEVESASEGWSGLESSEAPAPGENRGSEPEAALALEIVAVDESLPAAVALDGPLTMAEVQAAQEIAYFFALERGGGFLPPYDPWLAADDFCRAAGVVWRRRARQVG